MIKNLSKPTALLYCLMVYLISFVAVYLLYPAVPVENVIYSAFILDVIATVIVFVFSVIFNNSSMYDPYWSVAPVPILVFWMVEASSPDVLKIRQYIIIALVLFWGIRLTLNWTRRWKGFADEDWRYVNFRKSSGKAYWLVSFLGIHLFPTILVFLGCVAVFPALTSFSHPLNYIDFIAAAVVLLAIFIEIIADQQLWAYLKNRKDQNGFLVSGLWKYSRHPNYFGEVLFWIGLFLFSLGARPNPWWIYLGPVSMLLLFNFISVPMIDKRMKERKPGYAEYMKKTSGMVPWFPSRN